MVNYDLINASILLFCFSVTFEPEEDRSSNIKLLHYELRAFQVYRGFCCSCLSDEHIWSSLPSNISSSFISSSCSSIRETTAISLSFHKHHSCKSLNHFEILEAFKEIVQIINWIMLFNTLTCLWMYPKGKRCYSLTSCPF